MKKPNITNRTLTGIVSMMIFMLCSANMHAAKDIIVDHDQKTITLTANFVTFAPMKLTLYDAADLWNAQSGKYLYQIQSGDSTCFYTVNFSILVNEDPENDVALNFVTIIPDDNKFCKARKRNGRRADPDVYDEPAGIADGKVIAINERYKNNKYVLAHEMGHNLGLTHSEGLMHTHTGSNSITIFNISESLAQLQECFVEKTNTLRKKIELGIVPDRISYVGVVANHEEPIIS